VDDGSTDKTSEIAEKEKVTVIKHKKNEGYGKSLIDGIKLACNMKVNFIVTLDADGQHNPNEIPKLINLIKKDYDVVIGSRFLGKTKNLTFKRNIALRLLSLQFFLFTGLYLTDIQSGFRVYRREIIENCKFKEAGMGFSVESLIKLKKRGAKFIEVPVNIKHFKGVKTFFSVFMQGIEIGKTILKYF
ncbi:MAG: hypothetical protein B6U88_00710, partial [Candidatus Aenigmarchaeota archaeon ex4484_56]